MQLLRCGVRGFRGFRAEDLAVRASMVYRGFRRCRVMFTGVGEAFT